MKILLYASLTILLIGCGEKTITNTIYTPSTVVGDITGKVALYDTVGRILSHHGGATVALDNTPYSTTTDSDGFWTLHNVPAGNYTISFSKEGFSSMKDFTVSLNGNGTLYYHLTTQKFPGFTPTYLYRVIDGTSTLSVTAFQDYILTKDSTYLDSAGNSRHVTVIDTLPNYYTWFKVSFGGGAKTENQGRGVYVIFGKTNTISLYDPSTYSLGVMQNQSVQDGSGYYFSIYIDKGELYGAGFSAGQKVYCVAYSGSTYSVSFGSYYDPKLNHNVNSGVGKAHSEIKSFICP